MYKTLLSIFTILLLGISEANANKNIIKNLKEGGKINNSVLYMCPNK